jgi:hypothetical protein
MRAVVRGTVLVRPVRRWAAFGGDVAFEIVRGGGELGGVDLRDRKQQRDDREQQDEDLSLFTHHHEIDFSTAARVRTDDLCADVTCRAVW